MDTERLLGKLEEFMEVTKADLKDIKAAILDWQKYKWKVAGGAMVMSGIFTAIFQLVLAVIKHGD